MNSLLCVCSCRLTIVILRTAQYPIALYFIIRLLLFITLVINNVLMQGYCAKHSKKLDRDGTPRKATSSTPKKHSEMTEEEKKAAKARK